MKETCNIPPQHRRERGAALIIGLVLMTVLTLLAVSTMRTSTLELAMAGNAQFHEQAKQLAETGLRDAVSRINNNEIVLNSSAVWQVSFTQAIQAAGGGNLGWYKVTVRFKEQGKPPANYSSEIDALYFEIESTGMSTARNATSTLRQGFWKPVGT